MPGFAVPDGKVRRTNGDLFFAEVRPFDEIFREAQNMEGGGGGGGGGNEQRKITELQKQIINATWKLKRDGATSGYQADVKVVLDRMGDIRLADERHGPSGARRFTYEPTWILRGLTELFIEFDDLGAAR